MHSGQYHRIILVRQIRFLRGLATSAPAISAHTTNEGPKCLCKGPKCLLEGAEVSFYEWPKCLDEGPKCLFRKGPTCPIAAEVVGAEVVGAEVSKIHSEHSNTLAFPTGHYYSLLSEIHFRSLRALFLSYIT